jgi:hypothetical protein
MSIDYPFARRAILREMAEAGRALLARQTADKAEKYRPTT